MRDATLKLSELGFLFRQMDGLLRDDQGTQGLVAQVGGLHLSTSLSSRYIHCIFLTLIYQFSESFIIFFPFFFFSFLFFFSLKILCLKACRGALRRERAEFFRLLAVLEAQVECSSKEASRSRMIGREIDRKIDK